MADFKGFASMTRAADLLEKMQHDLTRMEQAPAHPYPAFDFFVTAEHVLDWIWPDASGSANRKKRTDKRESSPLLRITGHLANGAKHFKVTRMPRPSVNALGERGPVFDSNMADSQVFDTESYLLIELQQDEATALGLEHQHISTIDFARRVLTYWQQQLPHSPS